MRKTFKYRVKANKKTIQNAQEWLQLCRGLYNNCLEERIRAYKEQNKSVSCFDQIKRLPLIKKEFPEYKKVGSQALQDVIQRLDRAYQAFFRRLKNNEKPGFPRFKGKNRYDSFTLGQTGYKLQDKSLFIRNVGTFKIFLSRPIEGTIKTITVRRTSSSKWFACFSCDNVPLKPLPKTGKEIGIDVGCKSFLTTSNGQKIDNPRFFKKSQDLLKTRQQKLSRRKRGSDRRNKARILIAKVYEKIFNQRRDFHFKVAKTLLQENDTVYIEDMNHFKSYKTINRSMRDVAWFNFFDTLAFKAAEAEKQVIKVPTKNTSQMCSGCGKVVPKDLNTRIHNCPRCGLVTGRDLNAAQNILRLGQSLQGAEVLASVMN